jgi:hypothetical protein
VSGGLAVDSQTDQLTTTLICPPGMSTPRIAHPSFSLFMLALGVTGSNLLAIFLHMLDESVDMDKGLVLDFVGISTS